MRAIIPILAISAAGCVAAAPPPSKPFTETIRYETGACFGACPVYVLTVSSDGHGTFAGGRFTAATGLHRFSVTPAQYRAFAAALRRYRPHGELRIEQGTPSCKLAATDMPSVEIRWTGAAGPAHLAFYFGCDMDRYRVMADALRHAPDALPIADLVGRR